MAERSEKPGDVIRAEMQTLDSKISLIGQKISTIEKNEEVLGRTLVTLNERVRKLEQAGGPSAIGSPGEEVETLGKRVEALQKAMVTKQEIKELKYALETMNPLEYATLAQVRELLREEAKRRESKA